MQIKALKVAGCKTISSDKISGVKDRPGLTKCLFKLKEGDTLPVWRLDRLGRSMQDLISIIQEPKTREVGFKSLQDGAIDTSTASVYEM